MALEAFYRGGRPTCSECNDRLRQERGCKKPGFNIERTTQPFRLTSPMLTKTERTINECPTGLILREAPHTHDTLEMCGLIDNVGPAEFATLPTYLQHAWRFVSSEKERLRRLQEDQKGSVADSRYGSRLRSQVLG